MLDAFPAPYFSEIRHISKKGARNSVNKNDPYQMGIVGHEQVSGQSPALRQLRLAEYLLAAVWAAMLAACLLHRDWFTVEGIVHYTPRQPALAVLVMLVLFALKSLSFFIYCGLLYAASGVLFPLPAAIAVNLLGTVVMASVPYALGRRLGSPAAQYMLARYPKAAVLQKLRCGSDFFFVLITRLLGILPADLVSAYMGTVEMPYRPYLGACLLGFLPSCILFPIMGMNISNIRSPQFLISAGIALTAMLVSCIVFHFYRKKHTDTERKCEL